MSRLKTRRLAITTDAGGDATVNDTLSILGKPFAVEWVQGTLVSISHVTLTVQGGATAAGSIVISYEPGR